MTSCNQSYGVVGTRRSNIPSLHCFTTRISSISAPSAPFLPGFGRSIQLLRITVSLLHYTGFEAVGVAESSQCRGFARKLPFREFSYFGNLTALGNICHGARGQGARVRPNELPTGTIFNFYSEMVGERSQTSAWLMDSLCMPWFRRFRRSQRLGVIGPRG